MKLRSKNLIKAATVSLIAAFSFGLSLSCFEHQRNYIEAKAEESGAWTYNSGSFNYVVEGTTYEGTLQESTFVDYEYNLDQLAKNYALVTFSANVEGNVVTETFIITSATQEYDFSSSGYAIAGSWSQISVSIPFQNLTHEINMKKGDNYMVGMDKIVYVDDEKVSWDVVINSATYMQNDEKYELQYVRESQDTGETGDSGIYEIDNFTISFPDSASTAGYITGSTNLAGASSSSSVTLYVNQIDVSSLQQYDINFSVADSNLEYTGSMSAQTTHKYVGFTVPECNFVVEGYHFVNWSVTPVGGDTSYYVPGELLYATDNLTLKAQFEEDTEPLDGWQVENGSLVYYFDGEPYAVSINSMTLFNYEGDKTGEAAFAVSYSIDGSGQIEQAYQINNPSFDPVIGLSDPEGTFTGTITGISEDSDVEVTLNLDNVPYTIDGMTTSDPSEEDGWHYADGQLWYYASGYGTGTSFYYNQPGEYTVSPNQANFTNVDGSLEADIYFDFYDPQGAPMSGDFESLKLVSAGFRLNEDDTTYTVSGNLELFDLQPFTFDNVSTISGDKYRYNIIFDGNGATGGSTSSDEFYSEETFVNYELPLCGYQRDGYTFIGWSFEKDNPITYKPGNKTDVNKGETTFYAIWQQSTFNISFDANGGQGTMDSISVERGENTVPPCDFYKEGYDFDCWAVDSTSGPKVYPKDIVDVTKDYVLYAMWTKSIREGIWYDESAHTLRFYNTDLGGFMPLELQVVTLDFGPNVEATRAQIHTIIYHEDSVWDDLNFDYEMTAFQTGVENGYRYISGQVDLRNGDGLQNVKLYPDTLYTNVLHPGLNYVDGLNSIYLLDDTYEGREIEFRTCEYNEISSVFTLGYESYESGDSSDFKTIELTDGVISEVGDAGYQADGLIIEGYWAEINRRIKLQIFTEVIYNSLEEEAISQDTINEIDSALDGISLPKKDEIVQIIRDNAEQIPESTGPKLIEAISNTASDLADPDEEPERLVIQQEVIATVIETVVEVETNKPSDVGESRKTDKALPKDIGISLEAEVREFYEIQMQHLIGNSGSQRSLTRAVANDYKIDISGNVEKLTLDNEAYKNMGEFMDVSVTNMNKAGLKLKVCSGESMKKEVKQTIVKVKTSSFRDFDRDAANLQFAYDIHDAMMLHLQEVVVNELEKDYKPSGNREKDQQYQEELAACKDIESFTEIVIEVLRMKYNALTNSNIEQGGFGEKGSGIYWEIFKSWALDEPCPYDITFQELTDSTVETTTQKARSFDFESKLTNTEIVFVSVFGGAAVAVIVGAGLVGWFINKRKNLRGLDE